VTARSRPLLRGRVLAVLAATAVLGTAGATSATAPVAAPLPDVVDCVGAAPEAAPGTPEWRLRDAVNVACAEQRLLDTAQHPVLSTQSSGPVFDPYREPQRHAGVRFRHLETTVTSSRGDQLPVEVFAPCTAATCTDMPPELQLHKGPFPGVLIQHGGYQARKELHWWAAQMLAEAGYLTVVLTAPQGADEFFEDSGSVLDWFVATPSRPTADGFNPWHRELDRSRIGMAGHSGGGATANRHGSENPLVKAVVAWDRSGRYDLPERLRVPSLFLLADHGFTPQVRTAPPHPDGYEPGTADPGNKFEDYDRVVAQGNDSMKVVLRAATHLDWVPRASAASRLGEAVSAYYTLAWFDRYLKGIRDPRAARDGFRRLTAATFDASTDVHNISQGRYDAAQAALAADPYAGNVPYRLEGLPVRDRLSFSFVSKCRLTAPTGAVRATSDDIRTTGCTAPDRRP
jgi:dienelactone hydrolase